MSTQRDLVTLDQLSAHLTSQLQEITNTHESKITAHGILSEPDDDGCNWSNSVVITVGKNASIEALRPIVSQLVQTARKKFNVQE